MFLWDSQFLIQFGLKSLAGGLGLQGSCAPVSINLHLEAPWNSASRGSLTGDGRTNSSCFTSVPAPSWSHGLILPGILQDFLLLVSLAKLPVRVVSEAVSWARPWGTCRTPVTWMLGWKCLQSLLKPVPTPAGLSSAQLSHDVSSMSSFWVYSMFLGKKRRWILEILHKQIALGRRDAAVSSLLVKSSSKTNSLIQKYPRIEAGSGETGAKPSPFEAPSCLCLHLLQFSWCIGKVMSG